MTFDARRHVRFQSGMRRRIQDLRMKAEDGLDYAIDHLMLDRVDTYFKVEEGLGEIDRTLGLIEAELASIPDLSAALRLEARLEYLEDRFDELDSEMRQRPRRRHRRINLSDFFKAAGGGSGDATGGRSEITSPTQAYQVLGLEYGSLMTSVTAAFRRHAKKLHPDARKGDRSLEPELRRMMEAYQYLKEHLSAMHTEPPRNV